MATVRTEITSDFKTVHIISDSPTMNADFPVLEIYVNGVLTYTSVVGGSTTIGSTDYTTSVGVTDLNFTTITTTLGTEYSFIMSPNDIGLGLDIFPDGVYTFKLLDATQTADIFNYNVSYYDKLCCMSKKLNDAYSTSLSSIINDAEEDVIKISSLLESTKASAAIKDSTNANKKFKIITLMCDNCGCL